MKLVLVWKEPFSVYSPQTQILIHTFLQPDLKLSVRLKYQRLTPKVCKDIGIRKFEFDSRNKFFIRSAFVTSISLVAIKCIINVHLYSIYIIYLYNKMKQLISCCTLCST